MLFAKMPEIDISICFIDVISADLIILVQTVGCLPDGRYE